MSWYTRFTRFGDVHYVYGQEHDNSCGLASVMMVVFKMNKLKPGKQAMYLEDDVIKKFKDTVGAPPPVDSAGPSGSRYGQSYYGTYGDHLADVLNKLNVGTWALKDVGETAVADAIIGSVSEDIWSGGALWAINNIKRGTPIIVQTSWDIPGAHWVVVDTVNNFLGSSYASVNDPWDADVHITSIAKGQSIPYVGKPPISKDFGSGVHYKYDPGKPSSGKFNGWVVVQTG